MDSMVQLIMGSSTELDGVTVVRIIILMLIFDFVSLIIGYLAQLRR